MGQKCWIFQLSPEFLIEINCLSSISNLIHFYIDVVKTSSDHEKLCLSLSSDELMVSSSGSNPVYVHKSYDPLLLIQYQT